MGFFKKLFQSQEPPASSFDQYDLDTYPEPTRSNLLDLQESYNQLFLREENALRRLGLPLPTRKKALSFHLVRSGDFEHIDCHVGASIIDIPYYRTFRINGRGKTKIPKWIQSTRIYPGYISSEPQDKEMRMGLEESPFELLEIGLYYTIAGKPDMLREALYLHKSEGISAVVKKYKGCWSNRNPYGIYNLMNRVYTLSINATRKHEHNYFSLSEWTELKPEDQNEKHQNKINNMKQQAYFLRSFVEDMPETQSLIGNTYLLQRMIESLSDSTAAAFSEPFLHNPPTPKQFTLKILPAEKTNAGLSVQLLESLHPTLSSHAIFEVIKEGNQIYFQLTCAKTNRAAVERLLSNLFPDFDIFPQKDTSQSSTPLYMFLASPSCGHGAFKTMRDFQLDPYVHLLRLLDGISKAETVSTQVIFRPFNHLSMLTKKLELFRAQQEQALGDNRLPATTTSIINERLKAINKKHPSWLAAVRVYATNKTTLETLYKDFLKQYEQPGQSWRVNRHKQQSTGHNAPKWEQGMDVPAWNLVSTDELATLAHFPVDNLNCDKLETKSMKSALPPEIFTKGDVVLGKSTNRIGTKSVTLPDSVRDRHVYIVGKTRSGKSTLIFNIVRQDIARGEGVTVIDPHGDLAQDLLNYIPESRIEDAIYFDAGDSNHPIALDVFSAQSDDEIGLLADDLLVTFRRLSESWGERMESILRYTFHTLLRVPDTCFVDIQNILQDPDFRQRIVRQSNNPLLTDFWLKQFPQLPKDATQPILNRMSKFILSPALYNVLSNSESNLNFYDVIQNKKILLVNLSQGRIGDDNAKLLGSVIVSQLQLAVMRRAALPKEEREPYYLFVDEFQNFTTSAFDKILSEAGKYKLSLTLAHQYISQLSDQMRSSILGNVGTMIMFPLGLQDANYLRSELGRFEPTDLTNLSAQSHEAICKPATQSSDTFKFNTLAPPQNNEGHARAVIAHTHEMYCSNPQGQDATFPAFDTPEPMNDKKTATPPPDQPVIKHPVLALPKEFTTAGEKILHYVAQAEYLNTDHIKQLCYAHVEESARAPVVSRDCSKLIESKRLKSQPFGKGKIYFNGRIPNPTLHNLAVRDLYTKIVLSGYEIADVNFFPQLGALTPDLAVSFLAEDGSLIKTFWEYDTGTEGVAELFKKVERYIPYRSDHIITFICSTQQRLSQIRRSIKDENIRFAVLSDMATLRDVVFWQGQSEVQVPFFPLENNNTE